MFSTTALQRNHLYEFRGQQLRYSPICLIVELMPLSFSMTLSCWRKELSQNQVQREVFELVEFCEN